MDLLFKLLKQHSTGLNNIGRKILDILLNLSISEPFPYFI